MADAFGEERRQAPIRDCLRKPIEALPIAGPALFVRARAGIDGAVDRHGTDRAHQRSEQRPCEQAVARAERERPRAARRDQQRVDEPIGVPGDDEPTALGGDVLEPRDRDALKEQAHEHAQQADDVLVHLAHDRHHTRNQELLTAKASIPGFGISTAKGTPKSAK